MREVIVGRSPFGITLNEGIEYLLNENDEIMVFKSKESAANFLKETGMSDDEIDTLIFRESIGACKFCGSPLFESDTDGYACRCFNCDEDYFGIEQPSLEV